MTPPDQSPGSSDRLADSIEVEDGDGGIDGEVRDSRLKDTALSFGRITIDEDERTSYVGSAHWAAILDNVS